MSSDPHKGDVASAGRQRHVIFTEPGDDVIIETVESGPGEPDDLPPGLTQEADDIIRRRVTQNVRAGRNVATAGRDMHLTVINHSDD